MSTFQRGDTISFAHNIGGGGDVNLGIKGHNLDIECLLFDVTNNKHGGLTARIGGKTDAKGTVHASLDLDETPHLAPFNIYPGLSGRMLFGLSGAPNAAIVRNFIVPVVVGKIHYETAVEQEVRWSFDVAMNILAGTFNIN